MARGAAKAHLAIIRSPGDKIMKDELWMRNWNEGHPQFSADLHRGLMQLRTAFRRLGEWIALPRARRRSRV
ncbi:hypothetical protein ATM17_19450 [Sphingopyxis macrogoltabida]|uniref:Uncharacterized protein n=2 Tax=Sphingopyxis macrogoltabida TaxID=33050 RepID=A0AAC9FG81_SPHMC|nr:hypothetical protein LH19_18890 [Sphingopyxis macrogoltabida]AMU91193.1 hypothetical protein ATM17_19450 [Sphingopyxis macrogoltabida]